MNNSGAPDPTSTAIVAIAWAVLLIGWAVIAIGAIRSGDRRLLLGPAAAMTVLTAITGWVWLSAATVTTEADQVNPAREVTCVYSTLDYAFASGVESSSASSQLCADASRTRVLGSAAIWGLGMLGSGLFIWRRRVASSDTP